MPQRSSNRRSVVGGRGAEAERAKRILAATVAGGGSSARMARTAGTALRTGTPQRSLTAQNPLRGKRASTASVAPDTRAASPPTPPALLWGGGREPEAGSAGRDPG